MKRIVSFMSKAGLVVVVLAVIMAASPYPTHIDTAYAPELFGTAHIFLGPSRTGSRNDISGTITNAWVGFQIVGTRSGGYISGYLVQVSGPIIYDRTTPHGKDFPAQKIPFLISVHGSEFQGWIYFRGHNRPFCGGAGYIPKKCLLK